MRMSHQTVENIKKGESNEVTVSCRQCEEAGVPEEERTFTGKFGESKRWFEKHMKEEHGREITRSQRLRSILES